MIAKSDLHAALLQRDDVARLLQMLEPWADDPWVVGGAVRAAALGDPRNTHDVDFIVDAASLQRLRKSGLPGLGPNRHGNLRIESGNLRADIFSPQTFFREFSSVERAISFFDQSTSAIGVSALTGVVLDPIGGLADLEEQRVTLVAERWELLSGPEEQAVLRARLLRTFLRYELFDCTNPSLATPRIEELFADYPQVVRHHVALAPAEAARELRLRLERSVRDA